MTTDQPEPGSETSADGDEADGPDGPPKGGLLQFWELPLVLIGVGDYDGNFRYLDRAYRNVLGWSAEEMKSVPWWEFLHPTNATRVETGKPGLLFRQPPLPVVLRVPIPVGG